MKSTPNFVSFNTKGRGKTITLDTMRRELMKTLWEASGEDDTRVPILTSRKDLFKDIPKGARCN